MSEPTREPEAISEIRSGLAGGPYSCGGYGCYDHNWHMEDVLRAYDQVVAERDDAVERGKWVAAELVAMRARLAAAESLNDLVFAWWDREGMGPNYAPYTRDTHPEQQRVWNEWYYGNIELASRFMDEMNALRAAVAAETQATPHAGGTDA